MVLSSRPLPKSVSRIYQNFPLPNPELKRKKQGISNSSSHFWHTYHHTLLYIWKTHSPSFVDYAWQYYNTVQGNWIPPRFWTSPSPFAVLSAFRRRANLLISFADCSRRFLSPTHTYTRPSFSADRPPFFLSFRDVCIDCGVRKYTFLADTLITAWEN